MDIIKKALILGVILLFVVSYFPSISTAECPYENEECYELSVKVFGYLDYVIHDELVLIRYYGENESSPVLYENRTVEDGIAYFCIEEGDYWIDVRNIWEHITINRDMNFNFPYLLFEDAENQTEDNESSVQEKSNNTSFLSIAGFIFIAVILSIIIEKKKKR